jgi:uncharacterized membrane protein
MYHEPEIFPFRHEQVTGEQIAVLAVNQQVSIAFLAAGLNRRLRCLSDSRVQLV